MDSVNLGISGLRVSPIGLGSWLTFGNALHGDPVARLTRQALDAGINLIDTADVYAGGEAELALGKVLADVRRSSYVLASKCYFPVGEGPNDRGLSRKHVFESIEGSLRRLGTDYLDLYQCHRYDLDTPLEETCRAMDDLIRQGKILHWGVSDWTAAQIRSCVTLCHDHGWYAPISNQPPHSMFHRSIEEDVLPTCVEEGLGNLVFSPLAQGVLTGKHRPGEAPPADSRAADDKSNRFIHRYLTEEYLGIVEEMRPMAEELGIPMATLALAWCLRQPTVASVLVSVTRPEQLEQNFLAATTTIPDEMQQRLDALLSRTPMQPA